MKITKVDVMKVHINPEDNANWHPVLCRVYTDEGIWGDGEAGMAFGIGGFGAFGMLQDMAKLVIGMNPMEHEVIWEKLYRASFWGQNGGPVIFSAISALDMAMWDIKGKVLGLPLYVLLGGKNNPKLRCYASQLQFGWGDHREACITPSDYAAAALKATAQGYTAVKFDFLTIDTDGHIFSYRDRKGRLSLRSLTLVEERLAAVREAIGPEADIIMENHAFIDSQGAVQLGSIAEKYGVSFFEEPTTPVPDLTEKLSRRIPITLAHGERIYSRWQYVPYLIQGSLGLIQPDIGNCGGITEAKKICDMAHIFDVGVQAHVCASPLSTAAAIHLETVLPNFIIHEHHVNNLHIYNRRLCVYDYQPVDGYFSAPELPGIGNEFSEYCIEHSTVVGIS